MSLPDLPRLALSVDPGSQKCGLAIVRFDPPATCQTLYREIAETPGIVERILQLADAYLIRLVLIGDATGSKALQAVLRGMLPESLPLKVVPERYTTERARYRYFLENERTNGRLLLFMLGLATPPRPVDDYAAVLIAEDYFRQQTSSR